MSSVGATTRDSTSSARSGRPPRETTARTRSGRSAAAINAAAAPVLAPNRPSGSRDVRLVLEPVHHRHGAGREQPNIETKRVCLRIPCLFLGCQKVDQQRDKPGVLQILGNEAIARAETAAAAAVSERHDPASAERYRQASRYARLACRIGTSSVVTSCSAIVARSKIRCAKALLIGEKSS